jgi:acetolactate synthase-1/2/3 large subunit
LVKLTRQLTGADFLIQFLKSKKISMIFSISGAGNLAILDAIARENSIAVVFSHHEQAAVMEAQGYAKASGKPGVALLTTGGGISNGITGILSSHLDSVPVFIVSGNESSFHFASSSRMRSIGVQGFDSIKVIEPVSKMVKRVSTLTDLQSILDILWSDMLSERKGPVFLDFPMDLQRQNYVESNQSSDQLIKKSLQKKQMDESQKLELVNDLKKSKFPVLYLGNGCRDNQTLELLKKLTKKFDIPYFLSWSAIDLFPESDPLNIGRVGIYGDRASNILLQRCDLLIAIGTRLAIPQVGYDKSDFARKARKWVVEIDATECDKFPEDNWSVLNLSALEFLTQLDEIYVEKFEGQPNENWREIISQVWKKLPRRKQIGELEEGTSGTVHSVEVVDFLNKNLKHDATIVTDVGAGLLSGHYMIESVEHRIFTSQGLGEMGFGLPGAIGAYFAKPESQLICLNTDGAIMFNLQELQVIKHHKIPIKLVIFNNFGYAMIKVSQESLFESRQIGSGLDSGISFPEFQKIADLFGMRHIKIEDSEDLNVSLKEVLEDSEPVMIEVVMSPDQKYLPRLSTRKLPDGRLVSPPLEDMDPQLSIEQLESFLGYPPIESSKESRLGK